MSPINRLPPEILSDIFLHVLPESSARNPEHTPNILSQVCRHWHALALALPALWASLNITCNQKILHPPLYTIHTHLLRSAAYPLSITLNTSNLNNTNAPPNPQFTPVLVALVAARDRWRFVSITLVSEATQETLNTITQGDTPLLRSFHCAIDEAMIRGAPSIPLRALQGCPRLESLSLDSIRAPLGPALGGDAWPQLTTLYLRVSLTSSECLALLWLSPRLLIAKFQKISSLGHPTTFPHFLHARLHTLHALGAYSTALVDALTLPALMDLYLDVPPPRPPGHHTALLALLARSEPPLRKLTLTNLHLPEAVLLRTLALTGSLDTLCIADFGPARVPLTAAFIAALHPALPPAPPSLCPRLVTLWINALEAPDNACSAMIRARWGMAARDNGVAELREVHIALKGDGHERDCAQIRALKAEGMVVSLPRAL